MKKLEKLTLKEMKDSVMVISCEEEQKSIVAGSGYWITGSDGTQCYVEMDDVEVVAPKLYLIDGQYYPSGSFPPPKQESIGDYPHQSYGENLGDVALGLAAGAYLAACVAFTAVFKYVDTGSFVVSSTNFETQDNDLNR